MAKQSARGQILEREYGFLVRVFIERDPVTGKRKYINQKVRTTRKKEAEQVLTAMLRKLDMGELLQENTPMTVQEYIEHWLVTAAKPKVGGKTFKTYSFYMKHYVYSQLGNTKLGKLTPVAIQTLYSQLLSNGLSPATVVYAHNVLSSALKQAVKWRMLNQNPAQYVDLPKRQKTEMNALSQEQSEALLEAAKSDRLYTFFAVMLGTGLRPGEAVALMWKDFDPMKSTLTIQRSFGDVGEVHDFKPTKTAKGRQIKLPENLTKLLLEHKEKQVFSSYLIFPTVNNTPYNERNIVNRHFKPLLEKAKLGEYVTVKNGKGEDTLKFTSPYRLYDLRHTHATLLLKAGVNPKIVSERLGHSSVRITLDIYSHVLPGMQDEAASKLDLMLTFQRPETVATVDTQAVN